MAGALRVLHVTTAVGGGVPNAIRDICETVDDVEHAVLWPDANGEEAENANVIIMPPSLLGRRRAVAALANQFDVVHAHSSIAGLLARTVDLEPPVIYQPHCYAFDDPHRKSARLVRLIEKALVHRTAVTAVLTDHENKLALSLSRRTKVATIPNFSRAPEGVWNPTGAPRVIAVGRLARQKDPTMFGDIARVVKAIDPKVEFEWVGGGDPVYERGLASAGVRVTGWLSRRETLARMMGARVYVHTAEYEGLPLTILDAVRVGIPTLVRSVPSLAELKLPEFSDVDEGVQRLGELLLNADATEQARNAGAAISSRYTREALNLAAGVMYRDVITGARR